MNARSALFDVYGDHLRSRGGAAPIAALVKMLAALDIAAPAVRTAVSRMAGQGWLVATRLPAGPGYQLTARGERRLADAAQRIYRTEPIGWDGAWHVLVIDHVGDRTARERIRNGLAFLGYAALRDGTWISPRPSKEAHSLLAGEGVDARSFRATYDGLPARLAKQAWDLDTLARSYQRWLDDAHTLVAATAGDSSDRGAFATRSRLVHEWRKFLFSDPGLPRELLPPQWPGNQAAAYFDEQATQLRPAAGRYVDACLQPNGGE